MVSYEPIQDKHPPKSNQGGIWLPLEAQSSS